MAGTIPLSMTQQIGRDRLPLAGGKLYLIQAGTVSTPQSGYQDSALTILWPNPIILDADGRLPQFFLADGSIKIRLTDLDGVELLVADGIIVTGASSGGGGGSPVDATTVLATGDVKTRYGTGVLSGFVRLNARTIGSATSGASERANSDTQALFEYLWGADANLTVSTGRGISANADWVANKTLTLPDGRGVPLSALDDMGNSAASRYTADTFASGNATTLGSRVSGSTIATTNLPSHNHAVFLNDPGHVHNIKHSKQVQSGTDTQTVVTIGSGSSNGNTDSATTGMTVRDTTAGGGTANQTATAGSGTAFAGIGRGLLITIYLKL